MRRIGRDLAFAAGGRYVTRGKGGLSQPPFSEGKLLVLSREGRGVRMQLLDGGDEEASLLFLSVREEPRAGPLRRGLFSGDDALVACLSPDLPVGRDETPPSTLVFDGIQGRRVVLQDGP
ncbi:MAG TPA: hypothetical protein VEI51_07510 [Methanomicrobiales archaeon]|nr:hypothetical protein [Methanomicrobiales archaeon]